MLCHVVSDPLAVANQRAPRIEAYKGRIIDSNEKASRMRRFAFIQTRPAKKKKHLLVQKKGSGFSFPSCAGDGCFFLTGSREHDHSREFQRNIELNFWNCIRRGSHDRNCSFLGQVITLQHRSRNID